MRYSLVLIVLFLTGCVGQPTHYATSNLIHSGLPDHWSIERELEEKDKRSLRDLLDSPEMKCCLAAILENSHELKLSVLEQTQRALLADQSASQRKPEVNMIASANRTKSHDFGTHYQSRYQLGAQVSWELDLWGKLENQEASSLVDLKMSQFQEQALKRSLIGQTLKMLVQLSSSKIQQDLLRRSTLLQENGVIRAKQQIQMGSVRLIDLEAASLDYEQSKSQLILAERTTTDLEISFQRLTGLLGNAVTCPEFALDIALPVTDISSRYLLNRPDVQHAFSKVTRADLASDIAYKSLFPSFSLSLDATQTAVGRQNLLGTDPNTATSASTIAFSKLLAPFRSWLGHERICLRSPFNYSWLRRPFSLPDKRC